MTDRLSWLALLAALTFSVAVVMLGAGPQAAEVDRQPHDVAATCCGAAE
jgi:hypothetical protein